MDEARWQRMEEMQLTLTCGDVVPHGPRGDDDPESYRGVPLWSICPKHGPQDVVDAKWADGAAVTP